ncbi:hypothetical protein [Pedobacter yulinensis]|uniref:hypothetical protein n=1 Tax=Pedobacter yulinensis TaxID=2126353 RepID=UPI0013A65F76|nr:hypothetical protein [Pedobacter yulinensis]
MKTPKKPTKKSEVTSPEDHTDSLSELDQKGKRPFDDDEDDDDFELPIDDFDTFESFDDDDDDDKY